MFIVTVKVLKKQLFNIKSIHWHVFPATYTFQGHRILILWKTDENVVLKMYTAPNLKGIFLALTGYKTTMRIKADQKQSTLFLCEAGLENGAPIMEVPLWIWILTFGFLHPIAS